MLDFFLELFEDLRDTVKNALQEEDASRVVAKHGRDVTKKIDAIAEDFVVERLRKLNALVVSEERGVIPADNPEVIAVVDPLDGSFNALHSLPFYAVSIALAPYSEEATLQSINQGFVGNLATGDYFYAESGRGAYFNGKRIKVRDLPIKKSTLVLYANAGDIPRLTPLLSQIKRIRSLGCASLEMCYLSKGDFQLFLDTRKYLRNVDIAAGVLIAKESGAAVTELNGKEIKTRIDRVETLTVLAGSPEAHSTAVELLSV